MREAGGQAIAVQADMENPSRDRAPLRRGARRATGGSTTSSPTPRPPPSSRSRSSRPTTSTARYAMNVRAFVLGAQQAVSLMDDGGRIVALSSYGSIRAYPTYAALGAAKAALEAYVRYMAVEFGPRGINVNARQRRHHRVRLLGLLLRRRRACRRSRPCCRRSPSAGWARCRRSRTASGSCCTRLRVRHRADAGGRRRAEHRRAAVPRRRDGSAGPARHDRG